MTTNRKRRLPLRDAWKHYWSVLFLDGYDWQKDLQAEIRMRLYRPELDRAFMEIQTSDLDPPSWASELEIDFEQNFVVARFRDTRIARVQLFDSKVFEMRASWKNKNPFDLASGTGGLNEKQVVDCRRFVISVAYFCGNNIQNRLLGLIRVTDNPEFEISCRSAADPFANARKLPPFAVAQSSRINIDQNSLNDHLGSPKFVDVQIKQILSKKSEAGPRGSFEKSDEKLVEKMRELIDTKEVRSVAAAARKVQYLALREQGAGDESVERQLQRRFSEKYPKYIHRHSSTKNDTSN